MTTNVAFDHEVDLLVFGAGAGGMTAALTGAFSGLQVLLCEKADQVGGTTATSGGTAWVPGNALGAAAGVADKIEDAKAFLHHVVGNRGADAHRQVFLTHAANAFAELQAKSAVRFAAPAAHPDYLDGPGAAFGGRALGPVEFDGRRLGKDFARVRPPRDVFMGLGGMMVGRLELGAMLHPFASAANLHTTLRLVLGHFKARLSHKRGTRLLMGNALVGQLLLSLRERNVPIWYESPLQELILRDTEVIGAFVKTPKGVTAIRARKGVVLATGGIGWNKQLRETLFHRGVSALSQSPLSNTGDGISKACAQAHAQLDDGGESAGLWMPCSLLPNGKEVPSIWPHILLDRAKPGIIAVGPDGKRFTNEANSYHDFCMGMRKAGLDAAWLITDAAGIEKYGLGMVLPTGRGLKKLLRRGYLHRATTLAKLAAKIRVDAAGLADSVARHNSFARDGIDADFERGSSVVNRFNGDAEADGKNPCLGPIGQGPFYALRVITLDLAGAGGLATDEYGQVLNQSGGKIGGLYACGNDAASIFRGTYPGPGTTIGPAMTFGWLIAKRAAGADCV